MPRKPDFFSQLDRSELEKLEAYAREPGRTVDQVHEHLLVQGFTASRSAVGRWKARFDETDRMSAAAELADAIHTASADAGTVDVAGAVNLQVAQRLQAALVRGGEELALGDLLKASLAISQITANQKRVVELKRQQADAVKTAEAAAKSGASATDVVATIKKALGIAA